jgi:CMP-2-keto-3-deoxyoctulosonic acid synthetase
MKAIIAAVLLFATASSFAGLERKRFTYSVSGASEEAVIVEVEAAIPLIQTGKIKTTFQRLANCWPNNPSTIKIKNVSVRKFSRYNLETRELEDYYVGGINYLHKRCRD